MAAKKRTKKRTAISKALAVREPPRENRVHVYAAEAPDPDDRVYVRLPLPPDVVVAAREHYETGLKLWDMFGRLAEVPPGDLLETLKGACAAVQRDVRRIQRARGKRR